MSINVAVPLLGFCAYSGTGKTHLLEKLIPLLQQQGLKVAVIKHTHHSFDMDRPGKDSYRLRAVGANPVILASNKRWVLMQETSSQVDVDFASLVETLQQHTKSLDLILVEGFKHEQFAKIELHRPVLKQPLLCQNDDSVIAVATDESLPVTLPIPVLNLNNPQQILGFVINFVNQHHALV